MSLRWNGSLLGKLNTPNDVVARGAWGLRSHADFRRATLWPVLPPPITANLILHIDAARERTVTLNGSDVLAIADLSPSGRIVNQTTAARQPAYITAGRNGLNVMRFTAASEHFLNLASTTIPASHTVFAAFSRPTAGTNSAPVASFTSNFYAFLWFTDNFTYHRSNADRGDFEATNTSTGWFYATQRRNGTTQIRYRRNGATIVDLTSGGAVTNAASGSWNSIGRAVSGYMAGDIGEILVYDTNLSDSDIDLVEAYLAAKWGI